MPHVVRTSLNIGGDRLTDKEFSRVHLRQRTGWHHDFEILLRQDAIKDVLVQKAKAWIGKRVDIGIDLQEDESLMRSTLPASFTGVVTSIGLTRQSGTAEIVVRGQSPTIFLDDGANTRSFTDKKLQEIADDVINPYKNEILKEVAVKPQIFTDSLPYTVQYKESNFAFLTRLANRYGEWFFYDGMKLFFGKPKSATPIPLDFGQNSLTYFDLSVRAIPSKFEMRGYDYVTNKPFKEPAPASTPSNSLGNEVLGIAAKDIFNKTPSIPVNTALDEAEFKNLMTRREQVIVDEMVVLHGASRNPKLKIGSVIEVRDNTISENYGTFTITHLSHDIGQGGDYLNQFEAIPTEIITPPLSSLPEPPFCETQLANVTDVNDEDSLGRVRVQFPWQSPEEKSPWLRVASPYTGKDKGFYVIPEVGDQVLVAFENNHPDKPYVLTGMYNGEAKPEWFEASNRFKGFKSKGKNQWKFDDEAKSISIHAPSSISMSAGKKITISTGGKEDSSITLDAGEGMITLLAKTITLIAKDGFIDFTADKELKAIGKEKLHIVESKQIIVNGTDSVDVTSTDIKVSGATIDMIGNPINLNS